MVAGGVSAAATAVMIIGMHIIAPALLTYFISEGMRRMGIIKQGDMKLNM